LAADTAVCLACLLYQIVQIGAMRQHLGGDNAANQDAVGMSLQPASLKLAMVAVMAQHRPRFFGSDELHTLDEIVGDAGTAVGKTIKGVQTG
jgi:hypothetical protein